MPPQYFVLVVQPDLEIGRTLTAAIRAAGHDAVALSAAPWAFSTLRDDPPDVLLLEQSAPGMEQLLERMHALGVQVPVLMTRFAEVPPPFRRMEPDVLAALVRRAEAVAAHGG